MPFRALVALITQLRQLLQAASGAIGMFGVDQLDLHGVAVEFALEVLGRALDDNSAMIDDGEPMCEVVRLVQVMRREQP